MKKKRMSNNLIAIIIPFLAVIVAIIAVVTTCIKLMPVGNIDGVGSTSISESVIPVNDNINKDDSYINETNYKGELSEYPELYMYPFRKSDSYISNKEFHVAHPEIFTECETNATQFMESLFNVDYREIVEDKSAYDSMILTNCDYVAYYTKNWDKEDEETMYFFEYIEEITDYFVRNMVQMEAKFYTDDSLVYCDYYIFVRGELVFTVYSTEDTESEYEVGKEYAIPMEVALRRSNDNPSDRAVVSFGKASDKTFFLNP